MFVFLFVLSLCLFVCLFLFGYMSIFRWVIILKRFVCLFVCFVKVLFWNLILKKKKISREQLLFQKALTQRVVIPKLGILTLRSENLRNNEPSKLLSSEYWSFWIKTFRIKYLNRSMTFRDLKKKQHTME